MKNVLLYSGGMDSYIAWFLSREKYETTFVHLNHRYCSKELVAVKRTIPTTQILDNVLSLAKYEHSDATIPMRNLFLAMLVAAEGADKIWIVVQKDEMSIPDRTYQFFSDSSAIISKLLEREVEVNSPFFEVDKTRMVELYIEAGGDKLKLLETVGCYSSKEGHCGDCTACFRRFVALKNNDIDPRYILSERIKAYYRDQCANYSKKRQERMLPWLTQ